jgi:hypothetical protein
MLASRNLTLVPGSMMSFVSRFDIGMTSLVAYCAVVTFDSAW